MDISDEFQLMIVNVTGYLVFGFNIIAPFIFGKDKDLERVKGERKLIGEKYQDLREINEGYRITNKLASDIRIENGLKSFRYEKLPQEEERIEDEKTVEQLKLLARVGQPVKP